MQRAEHAQAGLGALPGMQPSGHLVTLRTRQADGPQSYADCCLHPGAGVLYIVACLSHLSAPNWHCTCRCKGVQQWARLTACLLFLCLEGFSTLEAALPVPASTWMRLEQHLEQHLCRLQGAYLSPKARQAHRHCFVERCAHRCRWLLGLGRTMPLWPIPCSRCQPGRRQLEVLQADWAGGDSVRALL